MPTGYTADVQSGKITEFKDFAMLCARAFGACIEMRDAPLGTPIPEEFIPSSYHKHEAEEAAKELARLKAMTPEQADREADDQYGRDTQSMIDSLVRRNIEYSRYTDMLQKVRAWDPPTPDHEKFKNFMIEQLAESISFDCSHRERTPPKKLTGQEWLQHQIESATEDVEYHQKEYEKEVERTRARTEWIRQLRKSIERS